jgi:hypothetical protein
VIARARSGPSRKLVVSSARVDGAAIARALAEEKPGEIERILELALDGLRYKPDGA